MSVYVDDYEGRLGRMIMSHMIADSSDELVQMALWIGLRRDWIQHAGTWKEHFDVSKTKRAAAVKRGAIGVTARQLTRKLMERREPKARTGGADSA